MDQTHEQVACVSSIQASIVQRILAMQDRPFDCPFAKDYCQQVRWVYAEKQSALSKAAADK